MEIFRLSVRKIILFNGKLFVWTEKKWMKWITKERVNGSSSSPLQNYSPPKMRQEINLEVLQLRRHKFHLPRDVVARKKSWNHIAFPHRLEIFAIPLKDEKNLEKCFSPSSSRKMSLQTLFSSFFLFLVILLLFLALRICATKFSFASKQQKSYFFWTQIKHFQPHTEAGKKIHLDGLRVSEKNSRNVFFHPRHSPHILQSLPKKKKKKSRKEKKNNPPAVLPAAVFPRFYFHLPVDMRNWKSRSRTSLLAGLKSGAGQDARLIKNFFISLPPIFHYTDDDDVIQTLRVRQEEKLLFQKLTRARWQEFSKI